MYSICSGVFVDAVVPSVSSEGWYFHPLANFLLTHKHSNHETQPSPKWDQMHAICALGFVRRFVSNGAAVRSSR
jgi:hypothetical protein